ncbi:GNAT family N-acetyltransferase [Vibrio parahaemolyticus]|uniref:GNAT family N-acetyltransferase n=1 Tax=Vibrio mediterranei TaxID=689 RepID=UPI0040686F1E
MCKIEQTHRNQGSLTFDLLMDQLQFKPTIVNWYYDTWGKRDPNVSVRGYREKLDTLLASGDILHSVVAISEGKLVATAHIRRHEIPQYEDYEYWLGGVFVNSAARSQGTATKLVRHIIERARATGIARLYLQTEDLSGGLYARLGWKQLHQITNKGTEVIIMVKELDDDT